MSLLSSSLKQQQHHQQQHQPQQLAQSFGRQQQQQQFIATQDQEQKFKNNPFFEKLFNRIDGLVSIIVCDMEGNIVARGYSEDCTIEFDNTFPSTHIQAAEQANKLPFGKNRYLISCYDDYSVLQMHTEPTKVANQEQGMNKSKSDASIENDEDEEEELGDSLFVSFICTSDTSLQLIIDLSDHILEAMKTLYASPEMADQ
ncbi:hypothetical protein FDP41_012243 [Naegleria fowleri]|uniref:Roadblock/LAMTOR2 domain-containing protein n=1 Tax=Naegleria fowleri TaxID=5763 RepID=A0A6A5C1P5_NAEFO|nr:uncharacterized protein FDP41_012243 [Naegleria fowleri]KAF0981586.1 hypothetical protein FDP41_012243 [Naegleria fowleri]